MKKCLVSYILESPGLEHLDFFNALKSAGAERIMSAHWVLQSEYSPSELRDHLAALLAPNDQLLVGKRFIFREPTDAISAPVTVVLNWAAGLKH